MSQSLRLGRASFKYDPACFPPNDVYTVRSDTRCFFKFNPKGAFFSPHPGCVRTNGVYMFWGSYLYNCAGKQTYVLKRDDWMTGICTGRSQTC